MQQKPSIVLLTGAGISAESGIPTFRASNGTWSNHRIEEVATPEGFAKNPQLVHDFYNKRRIDAQSTKPNAAHIALARLEAEWPGDFLLVTQNVDDLHEKAGSKKLLHMHGELNSAWCYACDARSPWHDDITEQSTCPQCSKEGRLRPDIVWFGEMPYHMETIEKALGNADFFAAIGTSGQVYPAAGFVIMAQEAGAKTFEINLNCNNDISVFFDSVMTGPASKTVPEFVDRMLTDPALTIGY